MLSLIRFHNDLDTASQSLREKELQRVYHPGFRRRLSRKIMNMCKTIRDSIMEVSNVLLSQAKKVTPAGNLLTTQDKYVSQMKNELIGSVETAYEPMLERYIGHRVIAEFLYNDKLVELPGILKDYTSEFIELLNVDYPDPEKQTKKKADVVLPRKRTIIRHLAE